MRSRAIVLLLALLAVTCTKILQGDWQGRRYWGRCVPLAEAELGAELADIHDTPFGSLAVREILGVTSDEAIAVLLPMNGCGTPEPRWDVFTRDGLADERVEEIEAMYRGP